MWSKIVVKFYKFIKISGVIALVSGLTGATISYLKHPSFEPYWPVISDFGVYVSSAIWFNMTAILTGIFLIIFWLGYSDHKAYSKRTTNVDTPSIRNYWNWFISADYGDCFLCLKRIIHWSFAFLFLFGLLVSIIGISAKGGKTKIIK